MTQQNDYAITLEERKHLLYNMGKLLNDYDYNYEDDALDEIISEWANQKAELISAFKKHPNYIDGKFMIAFNCDYERTLDHKAVKNFRQYLLDIFAFGHDERPAYVKEHTPIGCILPPELYHFIEDMGTHITDRTISKDLADLLESIVPEIHPHEGQKTSRVINKLCTYLGYNKHPEYNREYAKFADGLSPLTIKRHTVLSLNPLDYLTMSFGNSWASCHTIDKNNKRGMPNNYSGCYSSGTVSYMLDGSSMVFYTVDAGYDGDDYWTQPKINRQMFHWGEEKLVQGRLYPQDNDDDKDAYAPYRNIVQQIISTIFDFPNLWSLSRGTEAACRYIRSQGTHYRDYSHYSNCTLSKKTDNTNENSFVVGHAPICVECGNEHNVDDNINCCSNGYTCEHCGCVVNENEIYWVGDYRYCRDCVSYCDDCGEYYLNDDVTYVDSVDRCVCSWCLDNNYYYCEDCDEYYVHEDVTYIDSLNRYVCNDCLDDNYTFCDECEEYFPNDETTFIDHLDMNVCDECLRKFYTQCDECGEYYPNDQINHTGNEHLCNECYEEKNEEDEEC